ncbi:MAG: NosD domain-containing protein, partial [Methanosarcinaceae archaeon]|nr:NosD domain-containing protein [Methanosarcinaceae archaeon]
MILSIVFFFMLILSTGLSSAALNVTGLPGDGNCSSIQGAINNSSVGDTILVYDGTYTENLQVSVSGLTLKAVEGSNVILQPHPLDLTSPVITVLADNITIYGFNIEGPDFGTGIKSQGKNGLVLKNNTINTSFIGITLEAGSNCTLENNTVSGADFGISVKNFCKNNSLKQNSIKGCTEGLLLRNSCTENILSGNNFSGNFRALYLENLCCENSLASNFFVNNSISLSLEAECNGNLLENNTIRKAQYGVYLSYSCNNNTLRENNASDSQYAYYLKASCEKNSLNNNTAFENLYGFYLSRSPYNTLYGNRLSNNTRGVYVEACDNTTLISNAASHNIMEGVFLEDSSDNRLSGNNVSNNSEGIKLDGLCSRNTLKENRAFGNSKGLLFRFTTSNLFRANNISFNEYGLIFISSNNNILNDSFVKFNSECGLSLENSEHNTIYNNLFNNTKNAEDDNQDKDSGNIWNVSIIESKTNIYEGSNTGGNYWSDYQGNDSDGDGFGDKPYKSGNITDYLPLFDDVIPPVINVTSPINKTYSITSIPIYASSNEKISKWSYTIDGAKGSFAGTTPRTAEGLLNLLNGFHTLRVFATDISGNFNSTEVTFIVKKEDDADRDKPLIKIINPKENSTYTTGSLTLYASANESIQEWWYELDELGRLEFEFPELSTAQTSLELANGSHSIKVYGLDFAGNMNSSSVNFTVSLEKPGDGVPPKISILSPLNKSYSIR